MSRLELDNRRDREGMYPEVMGFFSLSAWSIAEMGYILPGLTQYIQDRLVLTLLVGSLTCVAGTCLGARFVFPNIKAKTCYFVQVIGLLMVILALTWMNLVTPAASPNFTVWLQNGGPTTLLEIGAVRSLIDMFVGIIKASEEEKEATHGRSSNRSNRTSRRKRPKRTGEAHPSVASD